MTLFFNYKSIPERLVHCGCPLRPSRHQWAAVFVGLWIKGAVGWRIQSQRLGTGRLPAERVNGWTLFSRTCAHLDAVLGKSVWWPPHNQKLFFKVWEWVTIDVRCIDRLFLFSCCLKELARIQTASLREARIAFLEPSWSLLMLFQTSITFFFHPVLRSFIIIFISLSLVISSSSSLIILPFRWTMTPGSAWRSWPLIPADTLGFPERNERMLP